MAARLLNNFEMWRMMEPGRQKAAKAELKRVAGMKNLSRDLYEIASKMLKETEN
jgi:hypothetical protein